MRFDEYMVLVSEIYPDSDPKGWAGNRGDSCASSARWRDLGNSIPDNFMAQFVTQKGFIRHPSPLMPDDWKETDFSGDQALPFYLCSGSGMRTIMKLRIREAGWRTGNGDLISPPFLALLTGSQWWLNLAVLGQLAIFKIPFRWDDGKKRFTSSAGSSCDVLNWYHCLRVASSWVKKLVSKDWIFEKISSYYQNEPNSAWILEAYRKDIYDLC